MNMPYATKPNRKWLEEEMIRIDTLKISWWKKFRLRVLAGKASVNTLYLSPYYFKFKEYEETEGYNGESES